MRNSRQADSLTTDTRLNQQWGYLGDPGDTTGGAEGGGGTARVDDNNADEEQDDEYPGLYDKPGQTLQYETHGNVCGGVPNARTLKDVGKIVTIDIFNKADNPMLFLKKSRKMMSQFSIILSEETMYTLVAVFFKYASDFETLLTRLIKKQEFYTSFRHFLSVFTKEAYPTLNLYAATQLKKCRQQPKEDVTSYYNKVTDCLDILSRDHDDHCLEFIQGLASADVRKAVTSKDYGDKGMKLADIARHAVMIEGRQKNLSDVNLTVSSVSGGRFPDGGGGRGRGEPRGRGRGGRGGGRGRGRGEDRESESYAKEPERQESRGRGRGGGRGGRGGRGRGRGRGGDAPGEAPKSGGNQQRGGFGQFNRGKGKKSFRGKRSVHEIDQEDGAMDEDAMEVDDDDQNYASGACEGYSVAECRAHFAKISTPSDKGRCYGCMEEGHKWDGQFSKCPSNCPFCGKAFMSSKGHAAIECPQKPANL